MTNRTEILHFRATPEEKGRIKENAGHAELHLSEWMRQRSLDRLVPTQPVVEKRYDVHEPPESFKAEAAPYEPRIDSGGYVVGSETYEQFMKRRMAELLGFDVGETEASMALRRAAAETALAEWAQR